jgi:hypothetical protein
MKKPRKPTTPKHVPRQEEPLPLDLLCNMAWLLLPKDSGEGGDEMAWRRCLHKADDMIREAKEIQAWTIAFKTLEREEDERISKREDVIFQTLTPAEQEERWVSYERGCQIITGLKKKQDAVRKFEAINSRTDISEQRTTQLRLKGFPLRLVAKCQEMFESWGDEIRKTFRKTYEKSGRYKRGAKKIPKK